MDIFSQIQKEVKKYSFNAKGRHNWEHTGRAYNLYSRIGKKENVDFDVLKYATVLHDIGRNHQDELNGKICHEEKGVMLTRKVLEKYNLDQKKLRK